MNPLSLASLLGGGGSGGGSGGGGLPSITSPVSSSTGPVTFGAVSFVNGLGSGGGSATAAPAGTAGGTGMNWKLLLWLLLPGGLIIAGLIWWFRRK